MARAAGNTVAPNASRDPRAEPTVSNGTYSNLRAHNDADRGDEDPADLDLTTSTSGIRGWNASQPNISMARATGTPVSLPTSAGVVEDLARDISDNEAAFLEDERDCDIALAARGPRRVGIIRQCS